MGSRWRLLGVSPAGRCGASRELGRWVEGSRRCAELVLRSPLKQLSDGALLFVCSFHRSSEKFSNLSTFYSWWVVEQRQAWGSLVAKPTLFPGPETEGGGKAHLL